MQQTINKIGLGTLFSGIGAIEQTFLKLNINHEIVFASDNGEREITESREQIEDIIKDLPIEKTKRQ
jgi:DNA (cytosine-5)-methyltransferase 1